VAEKPARTVIYFSWHCAVLYNNNAKLLSI
jgi:hypothetical protein